VSEYDVEPVSELYVDEDGELQLEPPDFGVDEPEFEAPRGPHTQGPVTARFFHADGSARSEPGPGSSERLRAQWALGQMAQEAAHAPLEFEPPAWQPPGVAEFDERVRNDAQMAVSAASYAGALTDYVGSVAEEAGVTDANVIAGVVADLQRAQHAVFSEMMAAGATTETALAELDLMAWDGRLDHAVRVALKPAATDAALALTKLAGWRQGVANETGLSATEALEQKHPHLRRMRERAEAYEARQRAWREGLRAMHPHLYDPGRFRR
jgi:hypothetical protein